MAKLYANISIDHQNRSEILESRIVTAAQCNADAVIITKSNPVYIIPDQNKYAPKESRWGNISYIDYARRCEVSADECKHLTDLCSHIGIPLIWSITDLDSAEFIKEYSNADTVKIHALAPDKESLGKFCFENFNHVIYHYSQEEQIKDRYIFKTREKYSIYYSVESNSSLEELRLSTIDRLVSAHVKVGYESIFPGVFPCVATAYKGVDYIEKFLGEDDSNPSICSPSQLYDFFKNLEILELANGK